MQSSSMYSIPHPSLLSTGKFIAKTRVIVPVNRVFYIFLIIIHNPKPTALSSRLFERGGEAVVLVKNSAKCSAYTGVFL